MTYKIKSLAYLVVFVAVSIAYNTSESNTENDVYAKTSELIKDNTTLSSSNLEEQDRE